MRWNSGWPAVGRSGSAASPGAATSHPPPTRGRGMGQRCDQASHRHGSSMIACRPGVGGIGALRTRRRGTHPACSDSSMPLTAPLKKAL
jgi:hypothetical protein